MFTRCRPYRKNDQAWVEQKNGAVVRRAVGYRRYEGLDAATAYASLRLFVNFFQPSFKLAAKARDGAQIRKKYHPPATPFQRLLADTRISEDVRGRVNTIYTTLEPVLLLKDIRAAQEHLVEIADRPATAETTAPSAPTIEKCLSGLRIVWQRERYVRPISRRQKLRVAGVVPTHWRG